MLKKLKISNFAIIENVELDFENQLTVITGETGSGKSILLGALNLLLGERADYNVIRDNTGKTVVEGIWQIHDDLKSFFIANDLDFDQECIIRREIVKEGKSRAFVNDSPVNLNVLKDLTKQLIHIHSQHNTLELRDKNFQLSLLDTLGDHQAQLADYQILFKAYSKEVAKQNMLREDLNRTLKERDYINFQIDELTQLQLEKTDYDALSVQLQELENAELILDNTSTAIGFLDHQEGILTQMSRLKQILLKIAPFSPIAENLFERIQSSEIELRDIQNELERFAETITMNPKEVDQLNEKLDAYKKALNKHQVASQKELQAVFDDFKNQSASSSELEDALNQTQKQVAILHTDLENAGRILSTERQKAATSISKKIQPYFERLKLKDARVAFEIQAKKLFESTGIDQVDLLFSTNIGIKPQPIEKVASGGELGRLMLILMTLLSERKALPTVIFDEIDTGVSGDVADRIGQLLREMGKNRQLLTITHLPQVASAGHHHLSVRKTNVGNLTISEVIKLNPEERNIEIAQLLSGESVTDAALENAKQLLIQND